MVKVSLETLNQQVKEDLARIPRGVKGSLQNHFRLVYSEVRKSHIAKSGKSKEETFKEVWNELKKGKPDFVPEYDHSYFRITS
ncbi:MAG: hypothetical protein ABSD73_00505 [Candidatus Bathyarchaeia archaeon]|jgi:hypothetical protein